MEQNKHSITNSQKQKKRIKIQQNVITSLCLACMIFSVGWSVYAAEADHSVTVEKSVSEKDSSRSQNEKSYKTKKDDSSSQKDESRKGDDTSSETDKKDRKEKNTSSSEKDNGSSKKDNTPYNGRDIIDPKDDLSDAVFIGDSRTVGMRNSSDKPKATFYCAVGLHIDTALTSKDVSIENGKTGTVLSALKKRKFGRIFLNFGVNELGWPNPDIFRQKYSEVIAQIKQVQPQAVIYAESILPVTASRDAQGDSVNNSNVKAFNELIKQAAQENGVKYLDCTPAVADANGLLPEDASTDGVHMIAEYCLYWQNYIINNT